MEWNIPVQDEQWVVQSKKNLTDLYENRPLDRMPFEFNAYEARTHAEETAGVRKRSDLTPEKWQAKFRDYEGDLRGQLEGIEKRTSTDLWDDRLVCLTPLGGALGWFVELFGAENEWFPNRPPYPHHAIHRPEQIDSLKPDLERGEFYRMIIEEMRFFSSVVGDKVPVAPPDLQSPVDQASMIMDYTNLIYLMMDDPTRAHALMRMVTETLIDCMRTIKKEMKGDWPVSHFGWWMPRGAFMSDDLLAVLNPELYREYAKPYLEMVGEEFGGIGVHSCGDIRHNLENIASTKGITGFNTHEPLGEVAPVVKNRVAVITGGVFTSVAPNYPNSKRDDLATGEEVAEFWWSDFTRLPEIKGQRYLYQCDALLKEHTKEETFEKMLSFSKECVKNVQSNGSD